MTFLLIQAVSAPEARSKLTQLYYTHYAFLKSKAAEIVQSAATAEDIVHDTLIRLIQAEETWQDFTSAQLLAYTMRSLHNTAVDYLRREHRTSDRAEITEDIAGPDFVEGIIERLDREELSLQLGLALQSLPERDRTILIQKYIFQNDNTQIAQTLGIKPESIPVTVNRAKKKLSDYFSKIQEG